MITRSASSSPLKSNLQMSSNSKQESTESELPTCLICFEPKSCIPCPQCQVMACQKCWISYFNHHADDFSPRCFQSRCGMELQLIFFKTHFPIGWIRTQYRRLLNQYQIKRIQDSLYTYHDAANRFAARREEEEKLHKLRMEGRAKNRYEQLRHLLDRNRETLNHLNRQLNSLDATILQNQRTLRDEPILNEDSTNTSAAARRAERKWKEAVQQNLYASKRRKRLNVQIYTISKQVELYHQEMNQWKPYNPANDIRLQERTVYHLSNFLSQNPNSVASSKSQDGTRGYPCRIPNCAGRMIRNSCTLCKIKQCAACLEILPTKEPKETKENNNENGTSTTTTTGDATIVTLPVEHICDPDTVASVALAKQDSKPCPDCGAAIAKISGCKHMWCPLCGLCFDWDTMRKTVGNTTNPHYFAWLRSQHSPLLGQMAQQQQRQEAGMLVGGCDPVNGFACHRVKFAMYEYQLNSLFDVSRHFQMVYGYDAARESQHDISMICIRHVLKEINEVGWRAQLSRTMSNLFRQREFRGITDIFGICVQDLARRWNQYHSATDEDRFDIFEEALRLVEYFNEQMEQSRVLFDARYFRIETEEGQQVPLFRSDCLRSPLGTVRFCWSWKEVKPKSKKTKKTVSAVPIKTVSSSSSLCSLPYFHT